MTVTLADVIGGLTGPNALLIGCVLIFITGAREDWVFGRELRRADKRISELTRENHALRQSNYRWALTTDEAKTLARDLVTHISGRSDGGPGAEEPW